MRRLAVLLYQEHIAWLEQSDTGRLTLRYLPDVQPATLLSLALPGPSLRDDRGAARPVNWALRPAWRASVHRRDDGAAT